MEAMTPEEVDQLVEICSEASQTDKGMLLYLAIIADATFKNIVRGHPDPAGLADELGESKFFEVVHRELDDLADDDKEHLADAAADHMRRLVVAVAKAGFKAMKNGIISSDDLTPDFLITAAACAAVANSPS